MEKISGLISNMTKCECLRIGMLNDVPNNLPSFGMKLPLSFKYPGISIGNDAELNYQVNWDDKLKDINNLLPSWSKRHLSLFGKVLVIKQLAVSKAVLVASSLTVPESFIKN